MWLPIDCVPEDLYLCVHDQWSLTVINIKTKLHLMLRPYYILQHLTLLILISHSHTRNKTFDVFNFYDWLLVLATVCEMLGLLLSSILHYKLRIALILLATVNNVHSLFLGFPTIFMMKPTTPIMTVANNTVLYDFWTYHQLLQELLPLDFTLVFAWSFLFLFFLVIFIEDIAEPEKLELSWFWRLQVAMIRYNGLC